MRLLKSFKYALDGVLCCLRYERNFRIHIVIALYALYFSKYYAFENVQYIVLFILFAMVIAAEMVNTAIEQFVDIETDSFNFRAKAAKDIAAGAVMVVAFFAAVIGVILFFDLDVLYAIAIDFIKHPLKMVALACTLVLSFLFISRGIVKNNKFN